MASCEQPKKDDDADGDTIAEVHSDAQPPELATPSPSWKVVAIPFLMKDLDSYDIGTTLHQKSGAVTDVALHRADYHSRLPFNPPPQPTQNYQKTGFLNKTDNSNPPGNYIEYTILIW